MKEEKLEEAKRLYETANADQKYVLESLFPELAGSEDKSGWQINSKYNKPQKNHSVLMKTTHGIAEGEWQGEQWHQYRWAGIVRDTDVLSWIELSDIEKQGEQKPIEWDADDDEKIFFLKARLKDYEDCIIYDEELSMCQKNDVRETTKEFLEWLDSIKERMGG